MLTFRKQRGLLQEHRKWRGEGRKPLKMGVEIETHHLVNHRGTTEVRRAGSLNDKAGSLTVRAPPQGLIVVQRLLYYLWLFCLPSRKSVSHCKGVHPDNCSSVNFHVAQVYGRAKQIDYYQSSLKQCWRTSWGMNNENAAFFSMNYKLSYSCFLKLATSFQKSLR